MASPIAWPAGLGGTGVDTATATNDLFSANVIWLNSSGGSDANGGTEPELPKATLSSAASAVAADGIIAIASGHTETIAATVTIAAAGVRVLGFGTGSNRPKFTLNHATQDMLAVSAADVIFENLYFVLPAQSASGYQVNISQAGCQILNSYFECNANSTTASATISSSRCLVDSCSFVATTARPVIGLSISGTGAGNKVTNTTFDGGSLGFTDYALKVTGANTELVVKNVTLSGKADFGITVTGSKYQVIGLVPSSQSRVNLTA